MVQIPAALDLAGPLSPASLGRGGAVDQHAAGLFDQSPGVPGHRHARGTGLDGCLVDRAAWRMNEQQTQQFFSVLWEGVDHLVERTIGLNLLGFGIISLCVSDLGINASVLPRDLRLLVFFFSVLLIWFTLHHGFAVHYASLYFKHQPRNGDERSKSIFEFPGGHAPVFFDFVYMVDTVGMTFEMSDVGARTTEVQKIVVVQSLLALLYTTTAISAFISLVHPLS